MQPVRVADRVAELLPRQRPAGRQQVLPGHRLPGRHHGNGAEGLHGAEGRHVQHQGHVRASPGGDRDEGLTINDMKTSDN